MGAVWVVILGVISCVVFAVIQYFWQNRPLHIRTLFMILWFYRRRVRISIATLLSASRDGSFVLFRMRIRSEAFGPPGGVVKFYRSAIPALNDLEFVAERVPMEEYRFETADLRGKLPIRKFLKFRKWLASGTDREAYEQCLLREIVEEIEELSLPETPLAQNLTFRHIRRVEDGPKRIPGKNFLQFRIFEVMELNGDSITNKEFCDWLFEIASQSPNVAICNEEDIQHGRLEHSGVIGSHAETLVGRRVSRPDQPLYKTN